VCLTARQFNEDFDSPPGATFPTIFHPQFFTHPDQAGKKSELKYARL
jgi:hypothetical protein